MASSRVIEQPMDDLDIAGKSDDELLEDSNGLDEERHYLEVRQPISYGRRRALARSFGDRISNYASKNKHFQPVPFLNADKMDENRRYSS